MMDRELLQGVVDELEMSRQGLPGSLCRSIADALDVTDVTLSLIGGAGRRLTLCSSSDEAIAMDRWQFTLDQGPSLEAARTGVTASSPVGSDEETPWPRLAEQAALLGYHGVAGVALSISGRLYGALNIGHRSAIAQATLENAEELAGAVAELIMSRLAEPAPALLDLADHAVVHQASGMIASQMGIQVDDALAVLRAHAWTEGRPLARVAEDVVSRQISFEEMEGE